jgi:5-bromo-4-chloroindolyl phosphate hydrolysis protein
MLTQYDYKKVEKQLEEPAKKVSAPSIAAEADKLQANIILIRERNKFFSIGFLLVSLMVSLYCILYFIRKTRHGADDIVHASGLVLIIFGTIIIVLMVDVEQQLTAAIGIMGAIAGYIFGTMNRSSKEEKPTVPPNPADAHFAGERDGKPEKAAEGTA